MNAATRMPALYIPHGARPCFFMDGNPPDAWDRTAAYLGSIAASLPAPPSAILLITVHWLADVPSFSSSARPGLIYDYSGFPPHTYALSYPAPGAPALAQQAADLLVEAGFSPALDDERGYGDPRSTPVAAQFNDWLSRTVTLPATERHAQLAHWAEASAAAGPLPHPHQREEHLLPLHIVAGAAGQDPGRRDFSDQVMAVAISAFRSG